MKAERFLERKRNRVSKLQKLQLPSIYKNVGWLVLIFSLATLFISKFAIDSELVRSVSKYGMLVGLLVVSISREKIEDELLISLRAQSYVFAFIFGVLYALFLPLLDLAVDTLLNDHAVLEGLGDFMILWLLLSVQVFSFEYLKRLHQ